MVVDNNKRIAKNTLLLYFRMLFTMGISLYTSRVILNTLGIEDFGIYNVVGGVIAMFGFISASMSSATSRFLTFELGMGNLLKLKEVFAAACTVHLLIALIILLFSETLGLWFLETQLVIPSDRMYTARIVFHLSVFSACVSVIQIPYTASVLSHEKMNVYALIEILNSVLKLLIVLLLGIFVSDKLLLYAFFLLSIIIIIFFIYQIYCFRTFKECRFRASFDKQYILPMLSFSSWDLYGNMSVVVRTQGVNMLLNVFFGSMLNAASGIAAQVQGAIGSFAGSVLVAVRPQVVKSYAVGDVSYTIHLINETVKYTSLLLMVLSLPLIIEMPFVLNIWLKNVPEYAVSFCRLTLIFNIIANVSSVVMSAIHATGKVKRSSVWNGTIYLLVLPITYMLFKWGGNPVLPFVFNVFFVGIGCFLNILYLKRYIPEFSINNFLVKSLLPSFLIGATSIVPALCCSFFLSEGWARLFLVILAIIVCFLFSLYVFVLKIEIKQMLKNKIYSIYK